MMFRGSTGKALGLALVVAAGMPIGQEGGG